MINYLIVITIGLILYFILNYKMLYKINIKKIDIVIINILEISSIFLGSKLLDIILYYNYYLNYNISQMIFIGFMISGGIILKTIVIYLYSILRELKIKNIFNILIPNTLLLYSILKFGCFINGCCRGINDIPLPIMESIIYLLLYLIIIKLDNKISISCIIFGILRIISFIFRIDISLNSIIVNITISIIIIIIGIYLRIKNQG